MTTAIEAQGLVKHYKGKGDDVEAVRGVDLAVAGRRGLRLPRPQRRRASRRPCGCSRRCCRSPRAPRASPASTSPSDPDGVAPQDRRRAAGGRARPAPDRPRAARAARRGCSASTRARRATRAQRAARAGRARGRGRPPHQGLLGRDEAATGPGLGARARARGAVPRRADHRASIPASRLTVWEEVRRINEQGTTVFLTTQYLEEADQLCDRLAIIDDGLIVREGTPDAAQGGPAERGAASSRRRRSTTSSSTRPAARATAPPARSRRCRHDAAWILGQRALREALPHARRAVPDALHPAVLPGRQHRPGGEDLPVGDDRLPAAGRATAPSSCRRALLLAARSAPRRCSSSRRSRAATSTSCARRRSRATSIVLGRLIAEAVKGVLITTLMIVRRAAVRRSRSPAACSGSSLLVVLDVAVGRRVHRLHAADRAQDAQRGGDEHRRDDLLPAAVPDAELRPARPADARRWRSPRPSTPSPT